MSVKDRVAIITGGAMGVGRFVAGTFGQAGAKVAVADIAPLDNVVQDLEAIEAEVLPITTDVTDESTVRAMVDQVYRKWGRIDILVNDAGIAPHFAMGAPRWPRFRDMDRAWFQRVIDTNLIGTFLTTKHVIPYMESLNEGHIINFGQGTGRSEVGVGSPARLSDPASTTCLRSQSARSLERLPLKSASSTFAS